jgi:hypothetical protein
MNPGYLTFVLTICFLVLLWSGWKKELIGQTSLKACSLLLGLWIVSLWITFRISDRVEMNMSVLILGGVSFYLLVKFTRIKQVKSVFISIVLLAAWHIFIAYIHRWSAYSFVQPIADFAIGEAFIAGLLLRKPALQIIALTMGIAIGSVGAQLLTKSLIIEIGHLAYWDQWWLAFILARIVAFCIAWMEEKWQRRLVRNK